MNGFLQDRHGNYSSKRLSGVVGYFIIQALISLATWVMLEENQWSFVTELLAYDLSATVLLLGVGVAEKFAFGNRVETKIKKNEDH